MIQWHGPEHAEGSDLWPRRTVVERVLDWIADDHESPLVKVVGLVPVALVIGYLIWALWLR